MENLKIELWRIPEERWWRILENSVEAVENSGEFCGGSGEFLKWVKVGETGRKWDY